MQIDHLHLHASELAQIAKINESNPALAEKLVDNLDKSNRREHRSFTISVVFTVLALLIAISGAVYVVKTLGIVKTVVVVLTLMAVGHFLRVYKTGEWSETGWIASIIRLFRSE